MLNFLGSFENNKEDKKRIKHKIYFGAGCDTFFLFILKENC
jgi:hypothetical protein